mmetsp:Transcript_42599/g.129318  ORF Transcript_42599/g.129318 Transcript_42599/m.129318 type:complete len:361 (-) Transcript_42599:101-1183(-)
MATQKEKGSALADYFAANAVAEDEEDEADFDPSDDGEESDPFEDGDGDDDDEDDDDDEGGQDDNYAILDGTLHLNDDGDRVVYSGTWCMKKDFDKAKDDGGGSSKDAEGSDKKKKKKTKFKLKSKQAVVAPESDGGGKAVPIFDLDNPTVTTASSVGEASEKEAPPKRTMLFDGFFFAAEEEGHRKIKERDLELTFVVEADSKAEDGSSDAGDGQKYRVRGRGTNEFGVFDIEGIYNAAAKKSGDSDGSKGRSNPRPLLCTKRYQPAAASSRSKSRWHAGACSDDDDDDEMNGDQGTDFNELIALNEEAHMSVEELRRRYYGGDADDKKENGVSEGSKGEPPAKKARIAEAESDDDGCGF